MRKILSASLLFVVLLSTSCSKESENVEEFKPVKLVFKEKKDNLLIFKNGAKSELTEEEKKDFYTSFKKDFDERESYIKQEYFLFESKNTIKLFTDNKERTFEYKFEDGFLKLLHKGKYHPYALGKDINQLSTIVMASSTVEKNGYSSGSSGEIKSYMKSPLSFEAYKEYHNLKLTEITGDKKFLLYRAEYIFKAN